MLRKRMLSIFTVVLLLATIVVIVQNDVNLIGSSKGAILHVPGSYTTIQSAVDNASAGDTVQISDGYYSESVLVNKSITISGNSTDVDIEWNGDYIIKVTADNVTLHNLTVMDYGGASKGIWIDGGKNVTIDTCESIGPASGYYLENADHALINNSDYGTDGNGVYVLSSNNVTVSNCEFYNLFSIGIRCSSSNNISVINNILASNIGFYATSSNNSYLFNNIIYDYYYLSWGGERDFEGISIFGSGYVATLINNTVSYYLNGILAHGEMTLKGNDLYHNKYGIDIKGTRNRIEGGKIEKNDVGVLFGSSSYNNTVEECKIIESNECGVYIAVTNEGNRLEKCNLSQRSTGAADIIIDSRTTINISYNNMTRGVMFSDIVDQYPYWDAGNLSPTNMVNGKPLYYIKNETDVDISDECGQLILCNCSGVEITDQNISGPYCGITQYLCDDVNLTDSKISDSKYGVYVKDTEKVTISGCYFEGSNRGVISSGSTVIRYINNTFKGNYDGINTTSCGSCHITDNTFSYNTKAIYLDSADGSKIIGNVLSSSGGLIDLLNSDRCEVTDNSGPNIRITGSSGNLIYHNRYVSGGSDDSPGNIWNLSYPFGGNHWASYDGKDYLKGPGQDILGGDGIGDDPFEVTGTGGAKDHYPLMEPPGEGEAGGSVMIRSHRNGDVISGTVVLEAVVTADKYLWVDWFVDGEHRATDPEYPFQFILDTGEFDEDSEIEVTASLEFATIPRINSTVDLTVSEFVHLSGSFGIARTNRSSYRPDMVVSANLSLKGDYQWFDRIVHELLLTRPSGDTLKVGAHQCGCGNIWGFTFDLPSDLDKGTHTLTISSWAYRHGSLLWINNCSTAFDVYGKNLHDSMVSADVLDPLNETINMILSGLRDLQGDVDYLNLSMDINFGLIRGFLSDLLTDLSSRLDALEMNLSGKCDSLNSSLNTALFTALSEILSQLDDVDSMLLAIEVDLGDLDLKLDRVRTDIDATLDRHDREVKENLTSLSDIFRLRFDQLDLLLDAVNMTLMYKLTEIELLIEDFRSEALMGLEDLLDLLNGMNSTMEYNDNYIASMINDTQTLCRGLYDGSLTAYGQMARDILSRLDRINSSEAERLRENLNQTLYAYGVLNSSLKELSTDVRLAFDALQKLDEVINSVDAVDRRVQSSEEDSEESDKLVLILLIIGLVLLLLAVLLQVIIYRRMGEGKGSVVVPPRVIPAPPSEMPVREKPKSGSKVKERAKLVQMEEEGEELEELEEFEEI